MNLQPAIDIVKHWEGLILHAYPDPGTGGEPWTIGYGTTGGVHPGETCTVAQAEQWLMRDLTTCANKVTRLVKAQINDSQFCALVSFAYNVGLGALAGSTLLRKLNAGAPAVDVANQFMSWTHAGGRVMPGLVNRRREERALFLSGASHHMSELEETA